MALGCTGWEQITCAHVTSIGQSTNDVAGSSGLCCGNSVYKVAFWANYSDGSQQDATVTAAGDPHRLPAAMDIRE